MWKLKIMEGIVKFREQMLPRYAHRFRRLAFAQTPHALFITCSDSRVVPNLVTSSDLGDLFIVRNVGNLIPPATAGGLSAGDHSAGGAIEYAVLVLKVSEIVVCGHSECGAMKAILASHAVPEAPNLDKWLLHTRAAAERQELQQGLEPGLKPHDRVSQINVLVQLEHIASYPIVRERVAAGTLRLHGWWFDVPTGSMYAYDSSSSRFELIDRRMVKQLVTTRPASERHQAA